jgi:hypothetical protein
VNKRVAVCNLCNCENELDPNKPGVKSEYFSSVNSDIPELTYPTIDYTAPPNLKHTLAFSPHYMFMLDISHISKEISFASYVKHILK